MNRNQRAANAKARNLNKFVKSKFAKMFGIKVQTLAEATAIAGETPMGSVEFAEGLASMEQTPDELDTAPIGDMFEESANVKSDAFGKIAEKLGEQPESHLSLQGRERHAKEKEIVGAEFWNKRLDDMAEYARKTGRSQECQMAGRKVVVNASSDGRAVFLVDGKQTAKAKIVGVCWPLDRNQPTE